MNNTGMKIGEEVYDTVHSGAVSGAIGGAASKVSSLGSGAIELGKTAVEDPALFKDALTYAVTGKDPRE